MEVDRGDVFLDGSEEYVTLACQWPSTAKDKDKTAVVHLKVTFCDGESSDDGWRCVMRACAVIVGVGEGTSDTNGVYEGAVSKSEAAESSRYSLSDRDAPETTVKELLNVWLQDARAALTGQLVESNENCENKGVEYVHCLQQLENEETLTFSWKLKHKFYTVALGSIRLWKVTAPSGLVGQMSVKFVEPLMRSLLTERRLRKQVTSAVSNTADQLLKDNQQLMDQIKSMAESREQDDERMIARFLRILNAKKLRIAEMQRELSVLKRQQNVDETVKVEEEELSHVTNRQGCGAYKETNLRKNDKLPEKKSIVFKKQKTDNINVREPILMDVDVDAVTDVIQITEFKVVENITVDPFEAPTQVDPVSDDSPVPLSPVSPSRIQQVLPTKPPNIQSSPIQLQMQSSPILQPQTSQSFPTQSQMEMQSPQSLPHQSEPKSVLDSLWYGIV